MTKQNAVNNAVEKIDEFLKVIDYVQKDLKDVSELIREADLEIQDLLHEIEFKDHNAYEGFQLYKAIKQVRRRRRELTKQKELLSPVQEFIDLHKQLIVPMFKMSTKMKQITEMQNERVYRARVRDDIGLIVERAKAS